MSTQSQAKRRPVGSTRREATPSNVCFISATLSTKDSIMALGIAQQVVEETSTNWTGWQIRLVVAVLEELRERLVASSAHSGRPLVVPEFQLATTAHDPATSKSPTGLRRQSNRGEALLSLFDDFPPDTDPDGFAELAVEIVDKVPIMNIPWESLVYRLVLQQLMERHTPHLN
jgi:hypothetical protein